MIDLRKWGVAPWVIPMGIWAIVSMLALGAVLGVRARSSDVPPAAVSAPSATVAPVATAQPKPLATVPTSVPKGTWAKIPRPGEELPDTTQARVRYMSDVLAAVPGEPPLKKPAALALLRKVKAKMAETGSIPPGSITVSLGESAASIIIANGTMATMDVRGTPQRFGACSEVVLASSLLLAIDKLEDFSKAGVRGVLCKSEGCSAVFDLRPTSSGGGLYGGDDCLSLVDALPPGLVKGGTP